MPAYGDRSDSEVCTVLKALQVGFRLLGPDAPAHLASLPATDEEVAVWLRRVGLRTAPGDARPAPHLMAPVLHVQLRSEMRDLLAGLGWGKAEVKATIVSLVTGTYFPSGIPDALVHHALLHDDFLAVLRNGIAKVPPVAPHRLVGIREETPGRGVEVLCQPWSFEKHPDGQWEPVAGAAVGTCYRSTALPLSGQLFNAYSQQHTADGVLLQHVVRHSVVDSQDRADMLVALLQQLDLGSRRRVRLLNLLTRRQGEEEALWQQQQTQMLYLKQQLASSGIQPVHLSYQANANCNYNFWNQGEDANTTSNALAWLKYAEWLLTDLLAFAEQHPLPEAVSTLASDGLSSITSALLTPIKSKGRSSWFFPRISLNEKGPAQYHLLQQLANRTLPALEQAVRTRHLRQPMGPAGHSLLGAIRTLCRLIRSQYPPSGDKHHDAKPLTRTSEFLSLALLDRQLGVVSCMNCKSGCDRSGLVHGLTTAANLVYDRHPHPDEREVFTRVCTDFDALAEVADDHTASFDRFVASLAQWQLCLRGAPDLELLLVVELRNWVFVVLMDIGWRVNIRSTGLAGLKFHLGAVSENPHVVMALPPFIIGKQSSMEEGYEVIPVHRKLTLNRRVAEFLNGASEFRGA